MIWLLILFLLALAAGLAYALFGRQADRPPALPARRAEPVAPLRRPPGVRHWGKQFAVPDPARACQRANALDGQRFALGKGPSLPLAGCEQTQCDCRYQDLVDQRGGLERRSGNDRREQVRFEERKDRRSGQDRRQDDRYDWRFTA